MIKTLIAFSVLFVALGIIGADDYEIEQEEAAHYCDMVLSGNWPNYEGRDCDGL